MCFTLLKYSRKRIAKEDIECYKVGYYNGSDIFLSEFQSYKYKMNIKQPKIQLIPYRERSWNMTDAYFHHKRINEGYHSFIKMSEAYGDLSLAKFIIPKGAEYYKSTGEYVSNIIVFVEWIKLGL